MEDSEKPTAFVHKNLFVHRSIFPNITLVAELEITTQTWNTQLFPQTMLMRRILTIIKTACDDLNEFCNTNLYTVPFNANCWIFVRTFIRVAKFSSQLEKTVVKKNMQWLEIEKNEAGTGSASNIYCLAWYLHWLQQHIDTVTTKETAHISQHAHKLQ